MQNLNKKSTKVEHEKLIKQFYNIVNNKENKYARAYGGILEADCDSTLKLLIILMIDDARLNKGHVTWAHSTYGGKINKGRQTILRWFHSLEDDGILIPLSHNKAGGYKNRHVLDIAQFLKTYSPVLQAT